VSTPSERPEGVFYEPLVWSISGFLVVSGVVLSILMWTNVIGPFRFLGLPGDPGVTKVGLWVPHAADHGMAPETSRRLGRWRAALPEGTPVVSANGLGDLVLQGANVIILADGRALEILEAAMLWDWVGDGGAAILTGALGVRGRDGTWRGFELMRRMLDEPAIHTLDRERSLALAAGARGPLSARLRPGERIRMAPEPGAPALPTRVAQLRWAGDETDVPDRADGAAKLLEVGRGRVVWLASGPESTWEESRDPWQGMVRLVDAALAWATHKATVEVLAWPGGARFAGVVAGSDPSDPDAVRSHAGVSRKLAEASRAGGLARFAVTGAALHQYAAALLADDGGWLARDPSTVEEWEERRDQLVVAVERTGPQRWLLKVTNLGLDPLREAVVRLHMNRPVRSAAIERTTLLQESPRLRLEYGAERLDVLLPELPGGASLAYSVDVLSESPLAASGGDGTGPDAPSAAYRREAERPIRNRESSPSAADPP
jgi:hypothetical protein